MKYITVNSLSKEQVSIEFVMTSLKYHPWKVIDENPVFEINKNVYYSEYLDGYHKGDTIARIVVFHLTLRKCILLENMEFQSLDDCPIGCEFSSDGRWMSRYSFWYKDLCFDFKNELVYRGQKRNNHSVKNEKVNNHQINLLCGACIFLSNQCVPFREVNRETLAELPDLDI